MCWSFPRSIYQMLKELPSGRGEGPSYMKVPYTYPPFKVICNHHCTAFGVEWCSGLEGGMKMQLFASVYLSVCVYWAGAQKPYLDSWREGMNEKFSILVFRDFGVGTKFEQKVKSVYCVQVVENCTKSLEGHMKIHFSSYFYYYY